MVDDITGVVKSPPVAKLVPPVGKEYQLIVPEDAVALSVNAPGPQRLAARVPEIVGVAFTTTDVVPGKLAQPFTVTITL